jgi:Flp pilus assembly protein TadD
MIALRRTLLLVLFFGALTGDVAAQDPADAAWTRGDLAMARQLYAERLAADSSDIRALHRLGLMLAWDTHYDESLALFDHLLTISPENVEARIDRARVLAWAGRFGASIEAYETTLQRFPGHRQTLLGLAMALAWANRLDSAIAVYDHLLAADSADLEAWHGRARATAWRGDLVHAEHLWHEALARDEENADSWIGLSQTLRWQSRPDAARGALDHVPPGSRSTRSYVEEDQWIAAAIDPRLVPTIVFEFDSDDNTITTMTLRGSFPMLPRMQLGLETYLRFADWDVPWVEPRTAWGGIVTAQRLFEPGWTVGLGVGASGSDGTQASVEPALRLSVASPGRYPVGGTLTLNRSALDATALLIENGVTYADASLGIRAQPAPGWSLEAGGGFARFSGSESNRRVAGYLAATRRIAPSWSVATRLRVFGFQKDLQDGYFDPDFYLHGELIGRWQPLRGPWHVTVEAAPGIEQVGSAGTGHAAFRLVGQLAYDLAPGRQVGFAALYSNAGLQAFATGEEGYRYLALTLSGSWVF